MKFVYFLVFAIIAQIYASPDVDPRNAKDEAKKLFDKLMFAIDKGITSGKNAVDKAFNQVKDAATNLETSMKNKLKGALSSFQEKIDDLNKRAAAKGIDLTPCRQYETAFENIPNTLIDDLTKCVNDKVAQAQAIVDDAINNVKKVEQDYKNVENDINHCGGGLKAVKCYAKLVKKIEQDTVDAPKKIAEDIAKATAFCTTLESSLEQCAVGKVEKVGELAPKYVAEFALCAGLNI